MKILATYNLKGGVGKTTTAVNIAFQAAKEGYRTLLWDLDPQGAASFYFRIKPKYKGGSRALVKRKIVLDDISKATDFEGLDLIPADFSFRHFDQDVVDTKRPVSPFSLISRQQTFTQQRYDMTRSFTSQIIRQHC